MDLSLPRRVEPELLDGLAAEDPRARRSRNDLQRIHRAMATLPIVQRALIVARRHSRPHSLIELGAGDGSLMLRLARRRAARWPDVRVTLLDRLNLVACATQDGLRQVGWNPASRQWMCSTGWQTPDDTRWDVVFASLFMHHFSSSELVRLLRGIAARTQVFLCCEPRRSALPLAGSMIGLMGAGR